MKTQEGPEKQSENKPKNKAGHVLENKGYLKSKPKDLMSLQHELKFRQEPSELVFG